MEFLTIFYIFATIPMVGETRFKLLKEIMAKQTKIEIWFDKSSQTFFAFSEDKESHVFLKKGGNKDIMKMIGKIEDDLNSTNDDFPDYLRFIRDSDGTWTIESYFDENVGYDKDGKPSIVDFMSNIDEMEVSLTDRGILK